MVKDNLSTDHSQRFFSDTEDSQQVSLISYLIFLVVLKRTDWVWLAVEVQTESLASESVQGAALPLEGIDHIHGGDSLPLGVLSVGDSIPDDVLQEDLEDSPGLLVDEARDTLDTASASQTPDGRLGDALDVIPEHLPVALGASLAESLSALAASSHDGIFSRTDGVRLSRPVIYTPLALLLLADRLARLFHCPGPPPPTLPLPFSPRRCRATWWPDLETLV